MNAEPTVRALWNRVAGVAFSVRRQPPRMDRHVLFADSDTGLFRRLGIRTATAIEEERFVLRTLRGGFGGPDAEGDPESRTAQALAMHPSA